MLKQFGEFQYDFNVLEYWSADYFSQKHKVSFDIGTDKYYLNDKSSKDKILAKWYTFKQDLFKKGLGISHHFIPESLLSLPKDQLSKHLEKLIQG